MKTLLTSSVIALSLLVSTAFAAQPVKSTSSAHLNVGPHQKVVHGQDATAPQSYGVRTLM